MAPLNRFVLGVCGSRRVRNLFGGDGYRFISLTEMAVKMDKGSIFKCCITPKHHLFQSHLIFVLLLK